MLPRAMNISEEHMDKYLVSDKEVSSKGAGDKHGNQNCAMYVFDTRHLDAVCKVEDDLLRIQITQISLYKGPLAEPVHVLHSPNSIQENITLHLLRSFLKSASFVQGLRSCMSRADSTSFDYICRSTVALESSHMPQIHTLRKRSLQVFNGSYFA